MNSRVSAERATARLHITLNEMANCDSPRIKGFLLQRPIFVSVSDLSEQVELVELVG